MANVLVLGAASWNRMVHVDTLPSGRSATVMGAHETEVVGSTGAGKAMTLAALGHNVTLHCALGNDAAADRIIADCSERGIRMIVDRHNEPSPSHLNIMDRHGGRHSIFLSNGADKPELDTHRLKLAINAADAIFISLCNSTLSALPLLAGATATKLLDLHDYDGENPWHDPFLKYGDVIQLSDVALTNPQEIVQRFIDYGAHQVVVTKAELGADIYIQSGVVSVPATSTKFKDSNGAGDAFSVALWHAQMQGHSTQNAAYFASAAAAFAVSSFDLFPRDVSQDDIWAKLQQHPK